MLLPGQGSAGRARVRFPRASCSITFGLLPDADIQLKFGDNQWANLVCGRSRTRMAGMSRESFPELPQMPELLAEIPDLDSGRHDSEDDLRDLGRRIALHAERRAAAVKQRRADDGGDGWPPAGVGGVARRLCRR